MKTLYEKYCYVNKYTELKLSDKDNEVFLNEKGFEIKTKDDCFTEAYIKIIVKELIRTEQVENKSSLDLFVEQCC